MPRILCSERVIEYSVEFKIKVIKLTFELDVKAINIAKVLNLHPMMIYRWRQEYREGKFVEEPSRRISSCSKGKRFPKKVGKVSEGPKEFRFRFIEEHRGPIFLIE